jgi:8-oxo-dGTP pyrophosphatase MutT (NUDIX family)
LVESAFGTLLHPIRRVRDGMTLGAQGAVIDAEDRVLLVRHSYRPGWFFPGGGVDRGEALETALARELEEEVGVTLTGPPLLHGVFANFASFPGDHIVLFVVRHWRRRDGYFQKGEIDEARLFARDELPETTDRGTRIRLAEIFDGASGAARWWDKKA